MPQIFQALQCYRCEVFQVHIVKKINMKWQCNICDEKQSIKKIYSQGSGRDCRLHVQKLNALRASIESNKFAAFCSAVASFDNDEANSSAATSSNSSDKYSNLEENLKNELEDSMDTQQEIYDNLDSLNNLNKNKENRYSKHLHSPLHSNDSKWTKYLDETDFANKLHIGNNLNRSDLYQEQSSEEYLSNFSSTNNKPNNNRESPHNFFDKTNNKDLDKIFKI